MTVAPSTGGDGERHADADRLTAAFLVANEQRA